MATVEELVLSINQLEQQNALLTDAWKAFRQEKFTGADGIDGLIIALTGESSLNYTAIYPPDKSVTPAGAIGPWLDLSNLQNVKGPIDFKTIKAAGYVGVWFKATQGTYFNDPYFNANVAAALAAGLKVRAYHFYDDKEDAVAQAQFFVAALIDGVEGVALDLEWGSGDQSGPAIAFLSYVRGNWQGSRDLYTNLDFLGRMSAANKAVLAVLAGLWLAYPAATPPPVPAPWARIDCWQRDWFGRVAGVVGDVDVDQMLPE